MVRFIVIAATFAIAAPAAAQSIEAGTQAEVQLPDASSSDEVIVSALRLPREKLPTGVYWDYESIRLGQIDRENSGLFMKCALKLSQVKWLRMVVDGEPNSADARFAQGWIIQTNNGCYPRFRQVNEMLQSPMAQSSFADTGKSRMDRGVIIEHVLKSYAPDAALTAAMMTDPAVKTRFLQRESVRNRLRVPEDRDALIFSSCLVEKQPVLATRLFRSEPGSELERGLTQTIINEARVCIGQTKRVTINPTLARIYIMDAFYRWVVAARGVDSLIPVGA